MPIETPPTYSPEMLEDMRLRDLAARIHTAIRMGNPTVLKRCAEYCATEKPSRRMTTGDVLELLAAQDVRCGLCELSLEATRWVIDYDHEYERLWAVKLVRGFICTKCNSWLGQHEHRAQRIGDYAKGTLARQVLK